MRLGVVRFGVSGRTDRRSFRATQITTSGVSGGAAGAKICSSSQSELRTSSSGS